jgi:hypothetical protein
VCQTYTGFIGVEGENMNGEQGKRGLGNRQEAMGNEGWGFTRERATLERDILKGIPAKAISLLGWPDV